MFKPLNLLCNPKPLSYPDLNPNPKPYSYPYLNPNPNPKP